MASQPRSTFARTVAGYLPWLVGGLVIALGAWATLHLMSDKTATFAFEPQVWAHLLRSRSTEDVPAVQIRGPQNEQVSTAKDLMPMLDEVTLERLQAKHHTLVICMQGLNDPRNDWSRLQVAGIRSTLEQLGIQVLAVTDGEFEVNKQLADYRQVIALHPDAIITIPLDSARSAGTLREAARRGIKLIFLDTVPDGMKHPRDYAALVMADSYSNGQIAAQLIAEHLNHRGEVALLHWRNKIFTCDQRSLAARRTFATYPGLRIVAERYFDGLYDIKSETRDLLASHPELDGLWVVWDTPALEAIQVIREERAPVAVATVDLSYESGREIARNGKLLGVGAQHPFQQGVAAALAAAVALAGRTPPAFVVVPGERVTRRNLTKAWQSVFQEPLPPDIGQSLSAHR
jgi:ribose transport system substrate-binding protein